MKPELATEMHENLGELMSKVLDESSMVGLLRDYFTLPRYDDIPNISAIIVMLERIGTNLDEISSEMDAMSVQLSKEIKALAS